MKRKLLVLFVIGLHAVKAQTNAVTDNINYSIANLNEVINVKYEPTGSSANAFLEFLAQNTNQSVRNIELKYAINQRISVSKSGNLKELIVNNGVMRFNNEFQYKGFPLNPVMSPSSLTYSVIIYKGSLLVKKYDFNNVTVTNFQPAESRANYTDSVQPGLSAEVVNLAAAFNTSSLNDFKNRILDINEYYNSMVQLDNADFLLHSIDPANIDFFDIEQRKLADAIAIIGNAEGCSFHSYLDLTRIDPAGFNPRLNMLKGFAQAKEQEMIRAFSNLHLAYYDKGMFFMQMGKKGRAEDYFKKSLAANSSFAPALLQLARINFDDGNTDAAIAQVDDILFKLYPDPQTREEANELAGDIYETYLDNGNQKLYQKKFRLAEEYFLKAQETCNRFSGIRCTQELFSGLAKAHVGIYNELIERSENLLSSGKVKEADDAAQAALGYQSKYKADIGGPEKVQQVIRKIRQQQYTILIDGAKNNASKYNYSEALESLKKADELQQKNDLVKSKDVLLLQTDYARKLISEKILSSDAAVKRNDLIDARGRLDEAESLIAEYLPSGSTEFSKKTTELHKNIFSQQCINAQAELELHLMKGKEAVTSKDYRKANLEFAEALLVNESNAECKLKTYDLASANSEILPAATYLKLFDRSIAEMKSRSFIQSYNSYSEAEKYFGQFDVGRFGIIHTQQLQYFLEKGSDGMLVFAGDHYRFLNQADNSLAVFGKLKEKGYDRSVIKGSLYQLGVAIGARDRKAEGESNSSWKKKAGIYTKDDKWWKSFTKGYRKGWKS